MERGCQQNDSLADGQAGYTKQQIIKLAAAGKVETEWCATIHGLRPYAGGSSLNLRTASLLLY